MAVGDGEHQGITIPDGCYRQPTESSSVDSSGGTSDTVILKGPYTSLETLKASLRRGDIIEGTKRMSAMNLVRNPGNLGTLTITCASQPYGDEEEPVQKALSETWTLKSVRNDVSILAYCGTASGNPARAEVEAWQKEPDGSLAEQMKYRKADGTEHTITDAATLALIGKIRKGVDSVMRFYPMLTKKRVYTLPPESVYENLAQIDTPTVGTSDPDTQLLKPGNLSTIISGHEWLKCQDDVELTSDGKFVRVESWIGVTTDDGGWDENLYGTTNRWPMPYSAT